MRNGQYQPSRFRLLVTVLSALLLVVAVGSFSWADVVVVQRNVNLRKNPSASQPPIRLLKPPDELELLSPEPTNEYLHVRTVEDEEGWVWSRNVRILSDEEAAALSATAATAISDTWDRPAPNQTTFESEGKTCGPFGDDDGNQTNLRKNRTDIPASYHDVAYVVIHDLPFDKLPKDRSKDRRAERAAIAKVEGVAVRTVGYLVAIKPQTGGSGESTNCHWTKASQTDWHMALVEKTGEGEKTSVVVETTPRVRKDHPRWTVSRLKPWVDSGDPVRISGWLMFDPEHRNHLGKYRETLWEIHPITKVELMKDGAWRDLDTVP